MSTDSTTPFGRYELVRKVATGGMAEIWLARQVGPAGFARQLVVKSILPELAIDPEFVTMFLDEARLAANLVHPNIAQVYDFGEVDGTYYIAMELVRGPNLKRLAWYAEKKKTPIPFEIAAKLIASAAEGLDHAHRLLGPDGEPLAIVHRDVTPGNLVAAYEGECKVLDFGIAKAQQRATQTMAGVVKGKYAYMAPEQIDGKPVDARADVWGLGATLYELVTGQRAFPADGELELVQQICDHDVKKPSEVRSDVPPLLEEILCNALARDKERRYKTARAFGEALERFAMRHVGEPITKGRVADWLEKLKAAAGDGLDPFGMGTGTQARTPGPAFAVQVSPSVLRTPPRSTPAPLDPSRSVTDPSLEIPVQSGSGTLLGMSASTEKIEGFTLPPDPETAPRVEVPRTATMGAGLNKELVAEPPPRAKAPTVVSELPGPPRAPGAPTPPARRLPADNAELPAVRALEAPPAEEKTILKPSLAALPEQPPAEDRTQLKQGTRSGLPQSVGAEELSAGERTLPAPPPPRSRGPIIVVAILVGVVLAVGLGLAIVKLAGAPSADPNAMRPIEAPPPQRAAGQATEGRLVVQVLPYGLVTIDGKEHGMSPLEAPLLLSPGSHVVRVKNPDNGRTDERTVQIEAGAEASVAFDLR